MMLYEHKFECRTRGLVHGPALVPDIHVAGLTWKVVIRSRDTKEELWVRPFFSRRKAIEAFLKVIGLDIERLPREPIYLPSVVIEGDLEYEFAHVQSFTTVGTTSWTVPGATHEVTYLVIAGGGGGGGTANAQNHNGGGGGGAGGYRTATNYGVTPGNSLTVTVGDGGAGDTSDDAGFNGDDSVFDTITSIGGGGGSWGGQNYNTAGDGGSGGGCVYSTPGHGTAGQGNDGGDYNGYTYNGAGGGGGAGAVGGDGRYSGSSYYWGGHGGAGLSSSITGSPIMRGGGGGGGTNQPYDGGDHVGNGGSGGGGVGALSTSVAGVGSPNTGGGGGGGSRENSSTPPNWGGDGGKGVVILSWSPRVFMFSFPPLG